MSVVQATRHSRLSQGCAFNLRPSKTYIGRTPESNLDNGKVCVARPVHDLIEFLCLAIGRAAPLLGQIRVLRAGNVRPAPFVTTGAVTNGATFVLIPDLTDR